MEEESRREEVKGRVGKGRELALERTQKSDKIST